MANTMVRISPETMEMIRQIRELAKAPKLSANDIIESAVASLQRQLLFESANQAYADSQGHPELRERREEQRAARRAIEQESLGRRHIAAPASAEANKDQPTSQQLKASAWGE